MNDTFQQSSLVVEHICSFQSTNIQTFKYSNIRSSQAKVGAIVEKKQGTAKTYFNTSDMRYF